MINTETPIAAADGWVYGEKAGLACPRFPADSNILAFHTWSAWTRVSNTKVFDEPYRRQVHVCAVCDEKEYRITPLQEE